jgi:hypothetical protein
MLKWSLAGAGCAKHLLEFAHLDSASAVILQAFTGTGLGVAAKWELSKYVYSQTR